MNHTVTKLVELTNLSHIAASIKRKTFNTHTGERETVSTHTMHLCNVIIYLHRFEPDLDLGKMLLNAVLHDLPEAICGDVDTSIRDKTPQEVDDEYKAVKEIKSQFPVIGSMIDGFSSVITKEDEFVWIADKLAPKLVTLNNFKENANFTLSVDISKLETKLNTQMQIVEQFGNDIIYKIFEEACISVIRISEEREYAK